MREELVEILVEEPSMKNFLKIILPKILPEGYELDNNCFIRDFEGKQDLRKQLPNRIKAYSHYRLPVKVIILHDQDSSDCILLKNELKTVIQESGNVDHLVRIVCKELEAWYLGDMIAIETVYNSFRAEKYRRWAKFRNPDGCNASQELKKHIPIFNKGHASRTIPKYMDISGNSSRSFNVTIGGIINFLQ